MNLEIAFDPPILITDENAAQKKTDCRGAMMEIGVTAKSEAGAKRMVTNLVSQLGGWEFPIPCSVSSHWGVEPEGTPAGCI